jgi:lysophospholipase L1-like esterase
MKKLLLFLAISTLLLGCSAEEVENKESKMPSKIVGWGDSMMQGAGSNEDNIISIVARELNISEYYNFGVGGLTSDNVVFLSGGKDFKVKVNDSLKLIEYPTMPFNQNTHQSRVIEIGGVIGELVRENSNFYLRGFESFNEEKTVKFKDAEKNKNSLVIIWVGRNDSKFNNTIENIKSMTEGNNAFVLSICNATWDEEGSELYERIERLNIELQNFYGDKFIDVREVLYKDSENIPSEEFLSDGVHLNSKGYEVVGKYVTQKIVENIK